MGKQTRPTEAGKAPATDELHALVARARSGDPAAVPALRDRLGDPATVSRVCGDLAGLAEAALVEELAGKCPGFTDAVIEQLGRLRADLLGESPSPVERLLVGRVVACWLQAQDADLRAAVAKNVSLRCAEFHQARVDRANRRFLAAVKVLAQVRRLALPVLQVNLARRQVNVVTSPGAA